MQITRRKILAGAAAAALPFGAPFPAVAGQTDLTGLTLGAARIDTLSDGHLVLNRDFVMADEPHPEADNFMAQHGVPEGNFTPGCTLALLRDGPRTVLFDAGSGPGFQPTAGKLQAALDRLGVARTGITHVVLTHAHPDHLWGLIDDFDEPAFPDAQLMIGRAEFDYWRDPATIDTIGAERQNFAAGARSRLDRLADRFTLIEPGDEPLPGVEAMATHGHTPGHLSYIVHRGDGVVITGDALANAHVAFARPDWHWGSDQDWDAAAGTRRVLLDRLAADRLRLIGFHLPGSGIGRAERQGDAYRFLPET
ncbi:MBL fold metallo-hydrolase [Acidimangrovimonas sediminis]|uniref:MBL fold metallo-hydrolase n=1 Tax=Acidimangrovimonas sediminis TaxID=2056283 RepID=UPI000C7FAA46|nr:MBL fold metallo-hydrolase [Acidimangrovimonas sediminis]